MDILSVNFFQTETKAGGLLLQIAVAAFDLPGVGDEGVTLGDEAGEHEGGTGAQIVGADFGALDGGAAVDLEHVVADFAADAHFGEFLGVGVAAGKAEVGDLGGALRHRAEDGEEGLHVGVDAGVGASADFHRIDRAAFDDGGVIAAEDFHAAFAEVEQGHFEVIEGEGMHGDFAAGDGRAGEPGDGFDVVGDDFVEAAAESVHAVDDDGFLAANLDARAHFAEEVDEIENLGADVRVPDASGAVREGGAEDGVFGGSGGADGEVDFRTDEAAGGFRDEHAVLFAHVSAEGGEKHDVNIVFAVAEFAAAGKWHGTVAEAGDESAEDEEGVADGAAFPAEVFAQGAGFGDGDGIVGADGALLAEEAKHVHVDLGIEDGGGVVLNVDGIGGEQGGGEQTEGAVFGSADGDFAVERAGGDFELKIVGVGLHEWLSGKITGGAAEFF